MTFVLGSRQEGQRDSTPMGRFLSFTFFSLFIYASLSAAPSRPLIGRGADYSIDVRLNPQSHSLDAREILVWHNTTARVADSLYFHLYPNAFKSSNTTFMTEFGGGIPSPARGWIEILSLTDMRSDQNLTDQIEYARPDDNNLHDSTVIVVRLERSVRPGDSITVSIDFHVKLPEAVSGVGWAPGRVYYFIARWFPKIGVYRNGEWTCHQFHASGGSFADFGKYDVRINVPMQYTVGATGVKVGESMNSNGTITYHFVADSVHGFAWTASPDFITQTRTFQYPGLPETKVILLLQPEHRSQAGRYFDAVDSAMKYFGLMYGPYPYAVLTVVDPSRPARVGAMSAEGRCLLGAGFPMLITAGTSVYTLRSWFLPEREIASEIGLQYWSAMVAVNETKDAWLARGLGAYSAGEVLEHVYGARASVFKIGGVYPVYMYPLVVFHGVPIAAITRKVWIHEPYGALVLYLRYAKSDAISENGYQTLNRTAYKVIACDKPDLVLRTLQGVVGKSAMQRIVQTYFEKYRFKHPTATDFENVCDSVSGRNLGWFFEQFVYGTGTVDFAVRSIDYYRETDLSTGTSRYITKVVVVRNGGVRMPVDLRLSLSNGNSADTVWNGQSRWREFTFRSVAPPEYAALDPSNKIPLDTNYANNSRSVREFLAPVIEWAGRMLSYFQNMLLNIGSLA